MSYKTSKEVKNIYKNIMRTMTIDTGESLRSFVEDLVASGLYKSNSEVIREGLRLLQEKQAASKIVALNKLLKEGENSEDIKNWNIEVFLKKLKKTHAPKKKKPNHKSKR